MRVLSEYVELFNSRIAIDHDMIHIAVIRMFFKRKIYNKFLAWKAETDGTNALLVEGARRIGKSTVVEEFAKNEYRSYILIEFAKESADVKSYFHLYWPGVKFCVSVFRQSQEWRWKAGRILA